MTTINQEPHQVDSNVVIEPPKKIEIVYSVGYSAWIIKINGHMVEHSVNGVQKVLAFKDVSGAMDWLIERDLVKTKAYAEFDKAVRKHAKEK